MHVQSFCFVNLNLLIFWCPLWRQRRLCVSSLKTILRCFHSSKQLPKITAIAIYEFRLKRFPCFMYNKGYTLRNWKKLKDIRIWRREMRRIWGVKSTYWINRLIYDTLKPTHPFKSSKVTTPSPVLSALLNASFITANLGPSKFPWNKITHLKLVMSGHHLKIRFEALWFLKACYLNLNFVLWNILYNAQKTY